MTTESASGSCLRRRLGFPLAGLALLGMAGLAEAASPSQWVRSFWPTAKAAGVSRTVYNNALRGFTPDPDVLKKAGSQSEFKMQIWDYLDITVTEDRIIKGRELLTTYASDLAAIEQRYGVDREVLVAIWGIESRYGAVLNDPKIVKSTIRSLATLAYQGGRRAKFGRTQLVAALKILQRGDVTPEAMTGSWAGAMGHTQFIPTTYNAYAVDFDGDGRRDIWNSEVDALGSAGAYLDKMGWRDGQTWGYEVEFTSRFNYGLIRSKTARTLKEWQRRGVRRVGGKAFPRPGDSATLYAPAGAKGPAFLVIKNFSVIKRYNNSNFYAVAVGHLSDRIRGGDGFTKAWPKTERPLTTAEKENLQKLLAARGHYDGPIDGKIGSGSRGAIRDYQLKVGLTPDGMDSIEVLRHLEANR
ncbi:MAG: lytic murein transglycosylase [Hyphomicrobiales bacterium]|nr:lytic murein transglycosylase [Hyphomicrobiales bacterium]